MGEPEKIYVMARREGAVYSFLLHGGKAVEIHCDDDSAQSLLGNIYIGKIKNIAKNMGAAFVEIEPGTVCHLALKDIKNPIYTKKGSSQNPQAGDELLVQVCREGIKSKYPSVTTNLTFAGKYVLLTSGDTSVSVSSKLAKEEKQKLSEKMKQIGRALKESVQMRMDEESEREAQAAKKTVPCGWLVRTNAGGVDEQFLQDDAERLYGQFHALVKTAAYRSCFSCLLRTPPSYLRRLQNLYSSEAERIITDDVSLYEEIKQYLAGFQAEDLERLSLYQDRLLPMNKLYSLGTQLERALLERVWLKSGGYLVIQPTEALTAIDVNTGKYEGGKNQEAAFLKINKEAAAETARQLRLRNISGIIIVDFINMKSKESVSELMRVLDRELKKDPVPAVLVDMTRLSLVEITRKKREKPLYQTKALDKHTLQW